MLVIVDIVFDGGFVDKVEVESFGICFGDIIVLDSFVILIVNEKNIILKVWDNCYGVFMVSELVEVFLG